MSFRFRRRGSGICQAGGRTDGLRAPTTVKGGQAIPMKRRRTIPLCVPAMALLLMTGAFSASAQTYEEVLAAYQRGDYATAYRGLRIHAAQGNASAQLNLGFMYGKGQGVPQDFVHAYLWLNLSASRRSDKRVQELRDEVAARLTPADLAWPSDWRGSSGPKQTYRRQRLCL